MLKTRFAPSPTWLSSPLEVWELGLFKLGYGARRKLGGARFLL